MDGVSNEEVGAASFCLTFTARIPQTVGVGAAAGPFQSFSARDEYVCVKKTIFLSEFQ